MGVLTIFRLKKKDRVWLEGGPGDAIENAVIIHCPNYFAGSRAQYKYLEKKCGRFITDWSVHVQMLIKRDDRNYDFVAINMKDGTEKTFYFDITEMLKSLNPEDFGIKSG